MSDNIQHTPVRFHTRWYPDQPTTVYLVAPGPVGGVDVRNCPSPADLARLIASAPDLLAERDALRSQLAEASSLLREIDEYLSSNAQNSVWSGSRLHQDVKRTLLAKLDPKLPEGR